MIKENSILEALDERGISRRSFLKFAAVTASSLALSGKHAKAFISDLGNAPIPTVIWLSFQQCTGCSESFLRAFSPNSIEDLMIFNSQISVAYHETLQAAAGDQAEQARKDAMKSAYGKYILIVDGSIPSGASEFWSAAAGNSNLATLTEAAQGAALVIALGACAAFGGIPAAYPNPTNALGYRDLQKNLAAAGNGRKLPPFINISGCPPMAEVITGTIALYLANMNYSSFIANLVPRQSINFPGNPVSGILDDYYRPLAYYGSTVHESCPRLPHFLLNNFAESHDDDGARQGYCLLHLGCKGPVTHNACTVLGWNKDPQDNGMFVNSPTHSGHGCLGCSEPNANFWDRGKHVDSVTGQVSFGSFYTPLPPRR